MRGIQRWEGTRQLRSWKGGVGTVNPTTPGPLPCQRTPRYEPSFLNSRAQKPSTYTLYEVWSKTPNAPPARSCTTKASCRPHLCKPPLARMPARQPRPNLRPLQRRVGDVPPLSQFSVRAHLPLLAPPPRLSIAAGACWAPIPWRWVQGVGFAGPRQLDSAVETGSAGALVPGRALSILGFGLSANLPRRKLADIWPDIPSSSLRASRHQNMYQASTQN